MVPQQQRHNHRLYDCAANHWPQRPRVVHASIAVYMMSLLGNWRRTAVAVEVSLIYFTAIWACTGVSIRTPLIEGGKETPHCQAKSVIVA